MNKLCNCKHEKIKDIIKNALIEDRGFFTRPVISLENCAELHANAIESIVSNLVHKESCNIGELLQQEKGVDEHSKSYFGIDLAMGEDNTTYVLKKEYSTEELKVPVPCKDCMEDLHDWRIWSQSQGETNFVCAKCFWRKTKRAAINPGPGTYGEVFEEEIKPPLKLNLN